MSATSNRWGPHLQPDGSVQFRLWAPSQQALTLDIAGTRRPMRKVDGWFEVRVEDVRPDAEYRFLLDDGRSVPDPASRRQAGDLAGPSILKVLDEYQWINREWKGRPWEESVIYEIHVGTFTPEGTFAAAAEKFAELAETGITAIEIMPVAQFPGDRGWGYDGVLQYAPYPVYGTPGDLKAMIDAAHINGLMVFLDVVYNHFGGLDNYLSTYAPEFFHQDKSTPWGQSIAFEKPAVRQYFIDNAVHWLGEFRFDGLRLDAVDQIEDNSRVHILEEIAVTVREAFGDRQVHLVVENPASTADLLPRKDGKAILYDADWNDDFHHSMHVAATGEGVGNYKNFAAHPWHNVARALAEGPIFPGKPLLKSNPAASDIWHASAYVHFLQNHDQVGNRAFGEKKPHLIGMRQFELWTALLLLSPQIPLMFMGDHYLADTPFHFFADYDGEIARAIRHARPGEARNFGGIKGGRNETDIPDPLAPETFRRCKLDWREAETQRGRGWRNYITELLAIRRRCLQPFIARPCDAKVLLADSGLLSVNWLLDCRLIELRANFSAHRRSQTEFGIRGEVIYSSGSVDGDTLGPASIVIACSDQVK
jgi:malto-oligosyltrehalose trehalohydrolase